MTRPAADSIKVQWTGSGTGTVTLGGAVEGFDPFPAALDGQLISYAIEHQASPERETGFGVYTHSGTTLTRQFVTASTAGAPNKQSFSAGTKHVRLTALASDVVENRATVDPGMNDDIDAGYIEGRSRWLNTTESRLFFCLSHASGAAVWVPVRTPATYQPAGDDDYVITRTGSVILVELTVALTDSRTFTLPTTQLSGDIVTLLRSVGGADGATWSRVGGDEADELRGAGDRITYQWNGSTWSRLFQRHGPTVRINAATYELDAGDDRCDLTFHTTSCLVTHPNSLPLSFRCRLIQQGSAVVTRTMESGATSSPSGALTVTNGDGSALSVHVIQNADGASAVYRVVREIPDAGVGGGGSDIADGGTFNPAAVLMTSAAAAEYDALTISSPPTFTVSGAIEAGGYAGVLITFSGGPHAVTWDAEFHPAVGSLPTSIPNGTYLFTLMGHPDLTGAGQDRVKVYIPGLTVPAHTHAQSDITSLVSDLAAKMPLAGGTFTGAVKGQGIVNATRSTAGTNLSATDSGGYYLTGGALVIPNGAIGSGWFNCDLEIGAITHDFTFNSTVLDISVAGFAAGEIYSVIVLSASTIRVIGPAGTFTQADFV